MAKKTVSEEVQNQTVPTNPPMNVQMTERLTVEDKNMLEMIKLKRELALANAKASLAQSEAAELSYNNVVLQLAMRYKLVDGDQITDDGVIQRKS